MSDVAAILQLHDVDLLLEGVRNRSWVSRQKKMGFDVVEPLAIERARLRLLGAVDSRWVNHYERALKRYGRAVTLVRGRVCQGCFITLPTSASPGDSKALTLCASCGRILYWP